ncbi:hypothetical protein PTB13_09360, partial [Bacillus sp. MHSD17]|nr:hypothetical protein [Bacillus sp. MHSD17]
YICLPKTAWPPTLYKTSTFGFDDVCAEVWIGIRSKILNKSIMHFFIWSAPILYVEFNLQLYTRNTL